jgi:hypothetical protein
MSDPKRKEEIFKQIKGLLSELVNDNTIEIIQPVSDENTLRIYMVDAFGNTEKIGGH